MNKKNAKIWFCITIIILSFLVGVLNTDSEINTLDYEINDTQILRNRNVSTTNINNNTILYIKHFSSEQVFQEGVFVLVEIDDKEVIHEIDEYYIFDSDFKYIVVDGEKFFADDIKGIVIGGLYIK